MSTWVCVSALFVSQTYSIFNSSSHHLEGLFLFMVQVPIGDYIIPLGEADIMRRGGDITVVGWGSQLRVLENVGAGEAHVVHVFC